MSTLHLPPRPGGTKQQTSDTSANTAKVGSETALRNLGTSSQGNLKLGQGADRIGRALKEGEIAPEVLESHEPGEGFASSPSNGLKG